MIDDAVCIVVGSVVSIEKRASTRRRMPVIIAPRKAVTPFLEPSSWLRVWKSDATLISETAVSAEACQHIFHASQPYRQNPKVLVS